MVRLLCTITKRWNFGTVTLLRIPSSLNTMLQPHAACQRHLKAVLALDYTMHWLHSSRSQPNRRSRGLERLITVNKIKKRASVVLLQQHLYSVIRKSCSLLLEWILGCQHWLVLRTQVFVPSQSLSHTSHPVNVTGSWSILTITSRVLIEMKNHIQIILYDPV